MARVRRGNFRPGFVKETRARLRMFVNELKSRPCTDCGRQFDPCAMDFDHRPGATKVGYISRFVTNADEPGLLAEIAKCDLVCACCHRVRTKNRGISVETRLKMSSQRKGILKSVSIRRKMSVAQTKAWAWRKGTDQ